MHERPPVACVTRDRGEPTVVEHFPTLAQDDGMRRSSSAFLSNYQPAAPPADVMTYEEEALLAAQPDAASTPASVHRYDGRRQRSACDVRAHEQREEQSMVETAV